MPSDSGSTKEVKFVENGSGSPSSTSQAPKPTSSPSPAPVGNEGSTPEAVTNSDGQDKKEPMLTPAPLPTKSPWKSVSTDIPVSKIPVESLEANKKNKPKATAAGTVKSSASTKWVPMKASIVVSGSKRTGSSKKGSNRQSQGSAGSSNNTSNNTSRSNSTASKKKRNPQQAPQQQSQNNAKSKLQQQSQDSTPSQPSNKNDTNPSESGSNQISNDKSRVKSKGGEENEFRPLGESGQQQSKERFNKHSENFEHPHRKQHNFSNQHHSRQQSFPRKRYYNNYQGNNNSHGFPHHHSKGNFAPYHGGSGRPFNHGYRGPRFPGPMHQQAIPPMYQQQFHQMQAILVAVNSVAKQMEYYFSAENLEKDEYLRSKLSKEGYAPVTLISKFYRVNNMSFGGDPYLILASLREIVANRHSSVDVATGSLLKSNFELESQDKESLLAKYFIRSKEWSNWLPQDVSTEIDIEKNLEGEEMDEFLIAPLPVAPVYGSGPATGPVPAPVPAPAPAPSQTPVSSSNAANTPQEKKEETEEKN